MSDPALMIARYREAALRYRPEQIRVLFIAESPPYVEPDDAPSYFFFEESASNLLFATIYFALYGFQFTKAAGSKPDLLRQFKSDRYWLVDVSEVPINKIRVDGHVRKPTEKERIGLLRAHSQGFLDRMDALRASKSIDSSTGLALINKPVWTMFKDVLSAKGYCVLNPTAAINFPGSHWDKTTVKRIRRAIA